MTRSKELATLNSKELYTWTRSTVTKADPISVPYINTVTLDMDNAREPYLFRMENNETVMIVNYLPPTVQVAKLVNYMWYKFGILIISMANITKVVYSSRQVHCNCEVYHSKLMDSGGSYSSVTDIIESILMKQCTSKNVLRDKVVKITKAANQLSAQLYGISPVGHLELVGMLGKKKRTAASTLHELGGRGCSV